MRHVFAALDAGSVRLGGHCVPTNGSGRCDIGAYLHSLQAVLYGATVTLRDEQPPVAGVPSAPALSDGRWHGPGQYSVSSTASDNTGVRERRVLLEGYEVGRRTAPGAADGGCGQVEPGLAYTHVKPCEGVRGVNGAVTTMITIPSGEARLDGTGELVATTQDTGGTSSQSAALNVKVDTTAPAAPAVSGDPAWSAADSGVVSSTVAAESDRAPIVAVDVERCAPATGCVDEPRRRGCVRRHAAARPRGAPRGDDDRAGAACRRGRERRGVVEPGVVAARPHGAGRDVLAHPGRGGRRGAAGVLRLRDRRRGRRRARGLGVPGRRRRVASVRRARRPRPRRTPSTLPRPGHDATGNRSDWVVSGTAAGVDAEAGLAAPAPLPALPPAAAKRPAGLAIRSARLEGGRVTVRAERAAGGSGAGERRLHRRTRRAGRGRSAGPSCPSGPRFTVSVPLPAALRGAGRGKLVVRYGGDGRYLPGSADRRVAR